MEYQYEEIVGARVEEVQRAIDYMTRDRGYTIHTMQYITGHSGDADVVVILYQRVD